MSLRNWRYMNWVDVVSTSKTSILKNLLSNTCFTLQLKMSNLGINTCLKC